MAKLSVLIPSRNEPFLNRTVDEVLDQATGDVQCVIMLDGAPAVEPLRDDPRILVMTNEKARGIGAVMMQMAQAAAGKYIMKLDAHCALAKGYDEALQADCDYDWLVVPGRYQLKDDVKWTRGYGPICYLYMTYPWLCEPQFGCGMHGKKWLGENGLEGRYFFREKRDRDILIDDIITFQGSCYVMHRDRFIELGGVGDRYKLHQEATSIGMKVWLSGGRCVRNKKTWYAHLHKGRKHGRGYFVSKRYCMDSNRMATEYWMYNQWPERVRDISWFVEHFWPIPGWPEDWDAEHYGRDFEWPGRKR